jgi:hypothetical protein
MHGSIVFCCLHSGYRHPVLNLIVDGGDALPDIKGIVPEANNIPSLQTRLPNVWSDSVVHSDAQRASKVAGSCSSYRGSKRTANAVSSFYILHIVSAIQILT